MKIWICYWVFISVFSQRCGFLLGDQSFSWVSRGRTHREAAVSTSNHCAATAVVRKGATAVLVLRPVAKRVTLGGLELGLHPTAVVILVLGGKIIPLYHCYFQKTLQQAEIQEPASACQMSQDLSATAASEAAESIQRTLSC